MRHYHRLSIIPHVLGSISTPSWLSERQQLMSMARALTAQSRAYELLRCVTTLCHLNTNQRVWFHRRIYGSREVSVSKIDIRTIYVAQEGRLYPLTKPVYVPTLESYPSHRNS